MEKKTLGEKVNSTGDKMGARRNCTLSSKIIQEVYKLWREQLLMLVEGGKRGRGRLKDLKEKKNYSPMLFTCKKRNSQREGKKRDLACKGVMGQSYLRGGLNGEDFSFDRPQVMCGASKKESPRKCRKGGGGSVHSFGKVAAQPTGKDQKYGDI